MNRLPVLLLVFPLIFVSMTLAQEQPSPSPSPQAAPMSATPAAAAPSSLTPRQTEELRADILMARKMYKEAISSYQQIAAREPRNAVLLNKIGVAYQELSESHQASRYYKKAVKADKTYASALNNLGTVEYSNKRYGKAIRLYKQTLQLRSDSSTLSTVYSNLGYAYFADKQYPHAMDCFQKALALDPQIFERHSGFGSIVQQREMTDPGLFYFLVAKSYALAGDIEHCAHFLRMARDEGYKEFRSAQTDPSFARVIKDPRIQELLVVPPAYANGRSQGS